MASRDSILAKLKANKPNLLELPKIDINTFDEGLDILAEFTKKLEVVGGNVLKADSDDDVIAQINTLFPDSTLKYSTLQGTSNFNSLDLSLIKDPKELEDLDILVLESKLAVAENGAVWVSDEDLPIRVLPFITKHLVLVLSVSDIVPYMHQAYDILKNQEQGFGVFISGPSKTADIEQSLVIGAHGALSLTIFIKE